MTKQNDGKAEFFPVADYPAMLTEQGAADFHRMLTKSDTKKRATQVAESQRAEIAIAVCGYIAPLEKALAAGDMDAVFHHAHEIRGLAGNADLEATGKIADGLCKYLDAAQRLGAPIDRAVVALHIDAVGRASSVAAEAKVYGKRVASELGALVARKLQAAGG